MSRVVPWLHVYVFSYNRGDFLANCIASIQRHLNDVAVWVVDDRSNDADTQAYLADLPEGVGLLQSQAHESSRHGGLYNNMQMALEHAASKGAELALFLQDDMQVVRDVAADDQANVEGFFAHFANAAFLNPLFLKGMRKRRDQRITQLAEDYPVYFRHYPEKSNPRGISYADAVIAHVPRLTAANWQFANDETVNAEQADKLFGKMGMMLHPFAMFLPEVPVFRGKKKSWAVAKAEQLRGTQPNRFFGMTGRQIAALKERDVATVLPVAEDYLVTERDAKRPFTYSQINVYPWLRVIHKISQKLAK
ncbi:MAG: glycosyltransferase [Gammaproteobacteria bacterium]|nr:glycosyltransferase [Gammaproteobacteria bacterium]